MSRSIHATRAELERERAWDWADGRLHRERKLKLARALDAKRSIKEKVRRERALAAADAPAVPLDVDALPVRIVDHGRLIHYPASEADVRAILRALPRGSADGLAEVELLLGAGKQRETARELELADLARDPTGRLASEHLPGVFEGLCLGTYSPSRARVRLFAYVYDPAHPDVAALEAYLKLCMLSTLVHEVAHHVDHRTRVARGRWRANDEEKVEDYAETRQHEWVREIVVPYIARAHPRALAELDRRLAERAGIALPLALLASDPEWGMLDSASAFLSFVHGLHRGEPLDAARVELARELHYSEQYELAQRVLDVVLAAEPEHAGARVMRADIFVHEQRIAEAEVLAREVLARDERCVDAWEVLADVHWQKGAWREVLAAAERGAELSSPEKASRLRFVDERARARLELGEYEALEADLAELFAAAPAFRFRAFGYRAIARLRAGRHAEALQIAEEGLAEAGGSFWRHELLAVRYEATRALEPARAQEPLQSATLDSLRHRGYAAWAEKLKG